MKTKRQILISAFFLSSFLFSLFIFSCDIKSPTEGIQVRVKNIPRTTTVRVEFIDSQTGIVLGTDASATVTVTFEGQNKNDVISEVNEQITELTTKNGVIYFAIRDNITPTVTNPVEVVLVCKSNKYLTTSGRIFLTNAGTHGFNISMVNLQQGKQGEGIETKEDKEGTTSTGTGTNKDIVITTTADPTDPDVVVTIPAGTVLMDETGKPLAGEITTRLTYFSPTSENATASFPGGLTVNVESQGRGDFTTVGFAAVDMSVNGTSVESFGGQGIKIDFVIPEGIINPETGSPIKAGDKIPMWSYNESNGAWKYEGEYTITSKNRSSNSLSLSAKNIKHLSWWNLDFFGSGSCTEAGSRILVDGCVFPVYVRLYYASNLNSILKQSQVLSSDPYIDFIYYNPNKSYVLKAYSSGSYTTQVGEITVQPACYSGTGNKDIIRWAISSTTNDVPVDAYVRGICPNGNVLDQGTLDVEIYKNGSWQLAGRIVDGYIKLCLVLEQEYNFRVFYDGEYYEQKHTAHSTIEHVDITLGSDIELCQ